MAEEQKPQGRGPDDPLRELRKIAEEPIPPGQVSLTLRRLDAWKRHRYTNKPVPPELRGWAREP
jgi:hypothetical protein